MPPEPQPRPELARRHRLDAFVPPWVNAAQTPQVPIRYRATALTLVVLGLSQTILGILYLWIRPAPAVPETYALVFGWSYPLLCLAVLPRTRDLSRFSVVVASCALVATIALVSTTGGIGSPALPLFLLVPSSGFAVGRSRAVARFGGAVVLGVALVAVLSWTETIPASSLHAQELLELRTLFILHSVVLLVMSSISTSMSRGNASRSLHRARARAEQASVAKSRFLAVMSHELRTPMSGLLGTVELLDDSPLNPTQREHLGVLRSSGKALLAVLNDILDFSRIEAGRLELQPTEFAPRVLAEQVRRLFLPVARNQGVALEVDCRVEGHRLADENRLRQVITNLVGNALKFTEAGSVRLRLLPIDDDRFRVEVHDTGIGIPREHREHMFSPFSQVDSASTRTRTGSGLGLAICRTLVEAMDGTIDVRSSPGQGSTFFFEIHSPTTSTPDPEPISEASIPEPERPLRVLLAEDNDVAAMVVQRLIERQGHTVDLVTDGAQAIQAVQDARYDMVLMDMHMPQVDGPEATRQIRALPGAEAQLPIYGLSADAIDDNQREHLAAGLDGFLVKPVDLARLATVLDTVGKASPAPGPRATP